MDKKKEIVEVLKDLTESEKMTIYTEYANDNCYDYIYDMDALDLILCEATPTRIANMIWRGDFRPTDNYFMFDGYANLVSFDYLDDEIDYGDIAQYIIDNDKDFDNDDIREILDKGE